MNKIQKGQQVRVRYTTRSGRTWENVGGVFRLIGPNAFELVTRNGGRLVLPTSDVIEVLY